MGILTVPDMKMKIIAKNINAKIGNLIVEMANVRISPINLAYFFFFTFVFQVYLSLGFVMVTMIVLKEKMNQIALLKAQKAQKKSFRHHFFLMRHNAMSGLFGAQTGSVFHIGKFFFRRKETCQIDSVL